MVQTFTPEWVDDGDANADDSYTPDHDSEEEEETDDNYDDDDTMIGGRWGMGWGGEIGGVVKLVCYDDDDDDDDGCGNVHANTCIFLVSIECVILLNRNNYVYDKKINITYFD